MKELIEASWAGELEAEFEQDYWRDLTRFVELRLGQQIHALLLDRILSGQDHKRGGSGCVSPSMVVCASCIASSSAD